MTNLTTAVTALKFIKAKSEEEVFSERYLFAAIGNQVQVFTHGSEIPSTINDVFPTEYRIHGFSDIVNNHMIIYGGRIVAVVHIDFCADDIRITLQERTEFKDWVWGVCWLSDDRIVAVACGHSTTYICDAGDLERALVLQSEEKELTWSTTLFTYAKGLRAVAGSSFGDVLSWTLLDDIQLERVERLLLAKQPIMAPANDKLLPVHRLCAHDGPVMRLTISHDSKRMATASVDRTVRVWEIRRSDCSACRGGCFAPLLVHYGHLARVWDVSFIQDCNVVSVGEDHSCRVWGEKPCHETACYHGHAGRNIWSVAVCDGLVATGGEDGSVKVRSIGTGATEGPFRLPVFENPRKKGNFKESCRSMVMMDSVTILLTTDYGRILRGRFENDAAWTEVFRDDDGTAFTPCSLAICDEVIIAGQVDGNVVVLRNGAKIGNLKGEGMVMGLFVNDKPEGCDVLIASGNGILSHWQVGDDIRYFGKYGMERMVKTSLVTAACIARDKGLVIAGDRGGRVLTYRMLTSDVDEIMPPVCMIRPHKDRVSGVVYSVNSVQTCGFDGAVITHDLKCDGMLDVRCVERAPDRTDTITRMHNGKILGFRGSEAVLWGLEDRIEYVRGDVGNWRRAHDVNVEKYVVGYWRGGGVYITRGDGAVWGMRGGHGGRVSGMGIVGDMVISVGADGVCMWREGVVVQRLSGHTSFVQGVASFGDVVVSVGGKDEVFCWELVDGVWRKKWSVVVRDLVGGEVVERCLCAGFDNGALVGRSDGSVIKIADGIGKIVLKASGAVLCLDCCDGRLVIGDTCGFVTIVEDDCAIVKMRHHEGGINDIKTVDDVIITGGDDGYVKCYNKVDGQWTLLWSVLKHTAAVTGLALHKGMTYSVGADQRVMSWTKTGVSREYHTAIVDASSIICTGEDKLVVGGMGVERRHMCRDMCNDMCSD